MDCRRLLIAIALLVVANSRAHSQILPPGAMAKQLATGYGFTEGPLYDGAGGVYFSDMNAAHIVRYDIAGGTAQIVDSSSGTSNGLIMDSSGHVISADRDRMRPQVSRRSATDITMVEEVLANGWMGTDFNGPNDLVMDAAGGIYFTDPDYPNHHHPEAVYYIDPAGALSRLLTFSTSTSSQRPINKRPNGIALSPGGSVLYLAVELNNRIMAYDVGPNGTISNERLFARTDVNAAGTPIPTNNGPDGLTVDAAGNVYSAVQNAVFAWSPTGERLFDLSVSQNPTNLSFGGADGRTLFITAGNSLFGVELNVPSPALGDFDGDGTVTAADYTVWRNTLGSTENLSADADGKKTIDAADYDVWRANFGNSLGSGSAATQNSVPEPNCLALLAFAILGLTPARRRG
jgi:gluconolactonase